MELVLAKRSDAHRIAVMSRQFVESGLPGWSWNEARVAGHVRDPDSIVVTARIAPSVAGAAIMHFAESSAHLNLLVVEPAHRRAGIGRCLVEWLEASARVAGTFVVSLEVRAANQAARNFYRTLGYRELVHIPRYYHGVEAAVRMSRDLRCCRTQDTI
ncbi:MAG: GNAT family N-acetyltransferase [Acidiferrobacterales bacterium]